MSYRYSITDLYVFQTVADMGSFSRAAEYLSLSVAAVSGRIKGLEGAFNVVLLKRSNQGIALTPAGKRLLGHTIELLKGAQLLEEDMQNYAYGQIGVIRIAANTTTITEFLPQKLTWFLEKYPKMDISLSEHSRGEVVRRVREGLADIGIFNSQVPVAELDVFPFVEDRLTFVVNEKHAWAKKEEIAFADTLIAHYVCLSPSTPQYIFLRNQAQNIGLHLKNRIHVPDFYAMATLVGHNTGVAVMPKSAAVRFSKEMPIKLIRLSDAWAENNLSLCVSSLPELPEHMRNLVESLILKS